MCYYKNFVYGFSDTCVSDHIPSGKGSPTQKRDVMRNFWRDIWMNYVSWLAKTNQAAMVTKLTDVFGPIRRPSSFKCPSRNFAWHLSLKKFVFFLTLPILCASLLFVFALSIVWMALLTARCFFILAWAESCAPRPTHTPFQHLHTDSFPHPLSSRACNKYFWISVKHQSVFLVAAHFYYIWVVESRF